MAEIDFSKYDEVKNRIDNSVMEYIRQQGLLNPNQSVGSYKRLFEGFVRQNPFDNNKEVQVGILYHQMVNLIENLKAKISELQSQKVLHEYGTDPDSSVITKIDNKINQAQDLLAKAVDGFEKYSEAKIGNQDVMMLVAKYKSACLEDRIFSQVIGQSIMPGAYLNDNYPSNMISKYEKYQELSKSIDEKEHGLKKYSNYMKFMREKDSKARTNRFLIRMLEKEYENSPIIANPYYKKGKNTKLDMQRYHAYMDLITDLPMKDYEISEFVLKSHIMERKDDGKEID